MSVISQKTGKLPTFVFALKIKKMDFVGIFAENAKSTDNGFYLNIQICLRMGWIAKNRRKKQNGGEKLVGRFAQKLKITDKEAFYKLWSQNQCR